MITGTPIAEIAIIAITTIISEIPEGELSYYEYERGAGTAHYRDPSKAVQKLIRLECCSCLFADNDSILIDRYQHHTGNCSPHGRCTVCVY